MLRFNTYIVWGREFVINLEMNIYIYIYIYIYILPSVFQIQYLAIKQLHA